MKRTVSLHNNVVPKLRSKLKEMFKHTKNKETIHFKASAKLLDFPLYVRAFFSFELRTQYLRMSRKMFYDIQDRPYSLSYHYVLVTSQYFKQFIFFKLVAQIIVRAFSLNSQNYVHMTFICVQELNTLVNVIIGCQTAEILKLKVSKTGQIAKRI